MPTLAPRLASLAPKIPIRIEIPWLTQRRVEIEAKPLPPIESHAQIHESAERSRLVSQILDVSPHASPDFLTGFSASQLDDYLRHMTVAHDQRGRQTRWVRPDNTPGVSVRSARV